MSDKTDLTKKRKNWGTIIGFSLAFLFIVFTISFPFLYRKYFKPEEKEPDNSPPPKENYQQKNNPYRSANLCNDKVLYPIQQLAPDYGPVTIADGCPCTQFIQAP